MTVAVSSLTSPPLSYNFDDSHPGITPRMYLNDELNAMRIASLLLSAFVGVVALNIRASLGFTPSFGASIIIGLLAGFLAPVARDLVAAVES